MQRNLRKKLSEANEDGNKCMARVLNRSRESKQVISLVSVLHPFIMQNHVWNTSIA